jgi:predicted dehydrogenase
MGRMGLRHVDAARALGMNVVAVMDRLPAALESARRTHGLDASQCFTGIAPLLSAARPDAIVIATTAPSHAPLAIAAANGGVKHILCEKPMAASLAEADAMIAACTAAGARLAVNHQMMCMPHYVRVKELIGSEALGPLASVLVAGSNFGLAMNASHYFEMFRFIAGEPIRSVQAWLDGDILPNPRGAEFEDRSGRVLAWSRSGCAMYMDLAAAAGHGLNIVYICRYGQIIVDELQGWVRVSARQAEHRDQPTTRYGMPHDVREEGVPPADVVGPTMGVWSAMLDGRPFPDPSIGYGALAALVAAHVSHETGGREIALDSEKLPRDRRFGWA